MCGHTPPPRHNRKGDNGVSVQKRTLFDFRANREFHEWIAVGLQAIRSGFCPMRRGPSLMDWTKLQLTDAPTRTPRIVAAKAQAGCLPPNRLAAVVVCGD